MRESVCSFPSQNRATRRNSWKKERHLICGRTSGAMDRIKERRSNADKPSELSFDPLTASVSRGTRFSQLKQWLEDLSSRSTSNRKPRPLQGQMPNAKLV